MTSRIRIVSPELKVPAIEAPRLQRMDVSSGLKSLDNAVEQIARAQRLTRVNEAQIGFADAFRELDDKVRRAPWNEKQALFGEGAKEIRTQWFEGVSDPQVRRALSPDFHRTYGTYLAHTREDAFKGETAWNIASTQDAMSRFAVQAAQARSSQERDMIVGNGAALADHLAIGGYVDELQRRRLVGRFLNEVDTAAVHAAIDDAALDPATIVKALREGKYPHLARDQVRALARLAEAEAMRRRSTAAADTKTEEAAAVEAAPEAIHADVMSRLTTGKPAGSEGMAKFGRLPVELQAEHKSLADGADAIFREAGDLRTKTPQEIASALERLTPLGAGVLAQARALSETIMADRARDPAAAVRDAVPVVAAAWRAHEESSTSQTLQAALRASRGAQTAVGIPAEQQRLVPQEFAEQEARSILNAEAKDQLAALREAKARYGAFAPMLLLQIKPFLPPQLIEADAQASPLAGELLWRKAMQSEGPPTK